MWRNIRPTWLLIAALGIGLAPSVMAWTSYGYGPYGPGYRGGYPEPPTGAGAGSYGPGRPPPIDRSGGYAGGWPPRYGPEASAPYRDTPQNALSPTPADPGYGSRFYPPWEYPGSGGRDFGRPAGFRISRATSDDAYMLTIALEGMGPEAVQVRTQGHWILLSRTHSVQQTRKDSLDDGRGSMRSFSYSSGTTNQRLSVPPDAILSAMSREDGADSIRLRLPRRGRQGTGKE
ncbi:hypothetical protein [Candidatus Thiosymbion oneisti]|uniref:hypothetical protein n=1 Tax=Candidatus Thiosymbion oneisti TaxID=589554 RepID=UPI00114CAD8A|nr:hypothetical protein [Candidatus Thiosymbion oneisti]